jgi:hypothetical protein
MVAAVIFVKEAMPAAWPVGMKFAVEVTAGAAVYALTALSIHGERVRAFVQVIRTGIA